MNKKICIDRIQQVMLEINDIDKQYREDHNDEYTAHDLQFSIYMQKSLRQLSEALHCAKEGS